MKMATFIKPCEGRLTSGFRTAHRPDHHGVDFAQAGTVQIKAVAAGRVMRSYTSTSYGEVIFVLHNVGGQQWETVYAHMRAGSRRFKEGQNVEQGEVLGLMGNTGRSYGQHLHFELHKGRWNMQKSNAVDPMKYLGAEDAKLYIKIVNVVNAAIIMDIPDRLNGKNIGTVARGTKVEITGSVRGENNDEGYFEVKHEGRLGYINAKFGERL